MVVESFCSLLCVNPLMITCSVDLIVGEYAVLLLGWRSVHGEVGRVGNKLLIAPNMVSVFGLVLYFRKKRPVHTRDAV